MSTQILLRHVDGLRLRQQQFKDVPDSRFKGELKEGESPPTVKAWKFDPDGGDVRQDIDQRTHEPLGVYSPYISYGIRNLVMERKGKAENISFRNGNVRQTLKVTQQELGKDKKWKPTGVNMVPPNSWGGAFIGDGNRAIVEELPT